MSDPKHPKVGDRAVDITDVELVDITPDHIPRMTKLREGHPSAITAILGADLVARKRAGLSDSEVSDLDALWAKCQRIDEVLPAVEKLHELLVETRLVHGHEIGIRLGEMAHQVRRRADRSPNKGEVAGPFEALLDYHFATGQMAAAAREKNKKNTEQEGGETQTV